MCGWVRVCRPYKDQPDWRELKKLPELERERILAERHEVRVCVQMRVCVCRCIIIIMVVGQPTHRVRVCVCAG
jgi:hypothetical protein